METDYNFWRDLLDTYQSLLDWLKFCWLVIPSGLLLIAGNGAAKLIRQTIAGAAAAASLQPSLSPPPPPPPSPPYRGRLDAYGRIHLEPVSEADQEALADMRGGGN